MRAKTREYLEDVRRPNGVTCPLLGGNRDGRRCRHCDARYSRGLVDLLVVEAEAEGRSADAAYTTRHMSGFGGQPSAGP